MNDDFRAVTVAVAIAMLAAGFAMGYRFGLSERPLRAPHGPVSVADMPDPSLGFVRCEIRSVPGDAPKDIHDAMRSDKEGAR